VLEFKPIDAFCAYYHVGGTVFQGLNSVILNVNDLNVSKAFYENLIGLKLLTDKPHWKRFQAGNIQLGIQPWKRGTEDERPVKHGVFLGFKVFDVDKTVNRLEKEGAHILVDPQDDEFGRYAEIVDPDGYIIIITSELK
jgi:predicted enzyme related to lactoylglutathione lyase